MAYMEYQVSIKAPTATVWAALMDVEGWPEWTTTMKSVKRIDTGAFGNGSRARLRLRGTTPAVWRVTSFDDGKSFIWENSALPGLRVAANHTLAPAGDGTLLTLSITTSGPLAAVVGPLLNGMSRSNIKVEAEGLKARLEGSATAS